MWRKIQRKNFTCLEDLASFLKIETPLSNQKEKFPLNLPHRIAKKIEKGNLLDPLLLQFLPSLKQLKPLSAITPTTSSLPNSSSFSKDPVQDHAFQKTPRLLHKYSGRVLLLTTSACAMHCRYCFRQNFPYETKKPFIEELEYIKKDPSIHEVILSGGDPLSLSNEKLADILYPIDAIPHVKLIRFHSRFPIGIPERIDADFLQLLKNLQSQITFVIHSNHAKEFDQDIFDALSKIQQCKIPVLNQSVLLKGVNDSVSALKELSLSLTSHGIIPYYLHQLDEVTGSEMFAVPIQKGLELIKQLRASLPGYAVPTYVKEIPYKSSKSALPLHDE